MEGLYKKVSGTFFIKSIGLSLAFIFQIIIGRLLKPQVYGQYTMILTYTTLLSIVNVLGMDRNLIKEIAKVSDNKAQCNSYLFFVLRISMVLYFFLCIFIIIFHNTLDISLNMIHLFLLMLLLKVLIAILDGFLQGKELVVRVTFFNVVLNNFLKIILFVLLIKLRMDGLNAALYSFIISEIFTLLLRILSIKKLLGNYTTLKINISDYSKSQFIKYSITVSLIAGIGILLQNVDKIMIAKFLNLSDVGIYKVAQNYVSLISVFVSPFIAFWPMISKLYNENRLDCIEKQMRKIVKIVTYFVVPMFFLFLFLSDKLLLIFGEMYLSENSQRVLIILAFAFLFDAMSGPIGAILTMTKYAKFILFNNIISLTLNIVLNFIFINTFGIIGVAIGTAVSIIVNNLISIIEVKVLLGIFSYDYRNFIQIGLLIFLNYFVCIVLNKLIKFENIYIYIVGFGGMLYLINGLIFLLYYKIVLKS